MDQEKGEPKPRVQSAARTVEILQAVARASGAGISARDLSASLKLPRQVVYHLVHTLVSMGMLRKSQGNHYLLGVGVATIAQGFQQQFSPSEALGYYAEQASIQTGETAYVAGWLNDEIVVLVNRAGSAHIHAAELPVGTTGDAHARASGKLLLALAHEDSARRYLKAHNLAARTPNTMTEVEQLLRHFGQVRQDLLAVDAEEFAIGLTCVAVPIGGKPSPFALAISSPTERYRQNGERYIEILRQIAASNTLS